MRFPTPSPYWGEERVWDSQTNIHNPMFDANGRVWLTARVRGPNNPAFCKAGSQHPSAKYFPTERSGRHLAVYDPATKKYTPIDTCYCHASPAISPPTPTTRLWTSGGGEVVGWLNTKEFLKTGDAQKAQGWTPLILDTNGDGKARTLIPSRASRSSRARTCASAPASMACRSVRWTAPSGARPSAIRAGWCGWCRAPIPRPRRWRRSTIRR